MARLVLEYNEEWGLCSSCQNMEWRQSPSSWASNKALVCMEVEGFFAFGCSCVLWGVLCAEGGDFGEDGLFEDFDKTLDVVAA